MKLRSCSVFQSCCTVCGWEALREEDLHRGNQNHRNSISRSEGDDPTFRESLRKRTLRLAAHTGLPPALIPPQTHMHVRIILWYLTRVNHFLRPWALQLAWANSVWAFKPRLFISVYFYLCSCLSCFLLKGAPALISFYYNEHLSHFMFCIQR